MIPHVKSMCENDGPDTVFNATLDLPMFSGFVPTVRTNRPLILSTDFVR